MKASFAAELLKLRKRPAVWLIAAVWVALGQVFGYLVPYVNYATAGSDPQTAGGTTPEEVLANALPANLVATSTAGLPVFIGSIAVILGALVVGSEYGWDTLKTALTQRPRRLSVYGGKLAALALATLSLVLLTFASGALSSWAIAAAEAEPVNWPSATGLGLGIGAGWLIVTMWGMFGVALGVLLRGVALPIGLGLVWALAVQNLIGGLAAPLLDVVATIRKGLPGANAGSLVAALGGQGDTPGVAAVVDGTQASITLAAYVTAFAVVAGLVLHRRDVTG